MTDFCSKFELEVWLYAHNPDLIKGNLGDGHSQSEVEAIMQTNWDEIEPL